MRTFSVATLVAATQAIKMQAQTAAQSKALASDMTDRVHTLIQTRSLDVPKWAAGPDWAAGEWEAKYYDLLSQQAAQISESTLAKLEEENPLPEMCDKAEGCVKELDDLLWETVQKKWESILESFMTTVTSTTKHTTDLIETKWQEMHQCGITYPCCTYGEEFQYNVKEMMRQAKSSAWDQHSDWVVREEERIALHSDCPDNVPQDCSSIGLCWDGSARANDFPSCSCPDFDHNEWRCPAHNCSEKHVHDDNHCQCECIEACPFPQRMTQNPDSCECDWNFDCAANKEHSDETGECVCAAGCDEGKVQNEDNCECEWEYECDPGQSHDANGICQCDNQCAEGEFQEPDCTCVPDIGPYEEPNWRTSYPAYETDETYPQQYYPAVISRDVWITQVCSGGQMWASSGYYNYCGWRFTMNDGSVFPAEDWSTVHEDNAECIDFTDKSVSNVGVTHYQSVGSEYLEGEFSGAYLAKMSFDYSENGTAGHWESMPCWYSTEYPERLSTENISLEENQPVNGLRFNTYASEGDFFIYNVNFATYD